MWFRGPEVGSENTQVLQVPRFWVLVQARQQQPASPGTGVRSPSSDPIPELLNQNLHFYKNLDSSLHVLFERHWPECEPSFTWESSKKLFKYTAGPPQLGFWTNWSEGDPGIGVCKISSGSSSAYPHWEPLSSVTKRKLSGENELVKVTQHQDQRWGCKLLLRTP